MARNAIFLYVRMLFAVCVNLYTSRLVLEYLGVEDFGVYNVVGGIVALMMFVNTSMSGATSRFITYCLGKGNLQELRATVSSAIQVHAFIAFLLLMAGETIGLWFVNVELNLPEVSMHAANWVFQFSLFTSVVSILQVPFNASVLSYERMDVFAVIEIGNVLLKCIVVFCLVWFPNRLIAYSGLLFAVSIAVCLMYVLYSFSRLEGFGCTAKFHKDIVKEMALFAVCDLYGNGTFAVRQQGINILVNNFFGVAYNAAGGVATQASGIISTFMNNVLSAFRPQIVKEYSVGNISRMRKLMYSECEILILLVGLVFVPLFFNMDFVMQLWLRNVPPYAVEFCRILLVCNVLKVVGQVIQDGIHATGKIRRYSFMAGNLNLFSLVLAYMFFGAGLDATFAYYALLVCVVLQGLASCYLLSKLVVSLDMKGYLMNTVKPFAVVGVSYVVVHLCFCDWDGWLKLLGGVILNLLVIAMLSGFLYPNYKSMIVSVIKKKINESRSRG